MRAISTLGLSAVMLGACVHTVIQTCPHRGKHEKAAQKAAAASGEQPAIPAFPLAALNGPHARSVKLYVNDDGTFFKYTVYVDRAAVPDWVFAMADKELGQGVDVELEVEQYADGAMVFEVTRKVDGQTLELSVDSVARSKRYIERKGFPLEQVPPAVRKTAESVTGFVVELCDVKEQAGRKTYELHGKLADREHSLYIAEDGKLTLQTVDLPAKVKVAR
jgi:hypothetical protein